MSEISAVRSPPLASPAMLAARRDPNVRSLALLGAAFASSAIVAAAVVAVWLRNYVNEDQALMWSAAEAWGRLQPHQPTFWGQSYGTTLEAAVAAIFHAAGISYAVGLPLAVLLLNLVGFGALAYELLRSGHRLAAVLVAVYPALAPLEFVVLLTGYNTVVGRMLAACAVALAYRAIRTDRVTVLAAAAAVFLLGIQFDQSSLLFVALIIPKACELIGLVRRTGVARLSRVAWPLVVPVGYFAYRRWWFDRHPEDAMHPAPRFAPSLDRLLDHLTSPNVHFADFGLRGVTHSGPLLVAGLVVALGAVAVVRRDVALGTSAATLAGLVMLILAVPRSGDWLPTPYYPASRLLVPLPTVLLALAGVNLPRLVTRRSCRWPSASTVATTVGCIAAVAFLVRIDTVGRLRDEANAFPNYPTYRVSDIDTVCAEARAIATTFGTDEVVFDLRTVAYACSALEPSLRTVYPPYERRSWQLADFLDPATRDQPFLLISSRDLSLDGAVALGVTFCTADRAVLDARGFAARLISSIDDRRAVLIGLDLAPRPPF